MTTVVPAARAAYATARAALPRRVRRLTPALLLLVLSACGLTRCGGPAALDPAALDALYAAPAPAPDGPLNVYHLGHSLVGRDVPAMVAQLAGAGHAYDSQLGWGATLKAHWGDDVVNGFDQENAHPRFRPAAEAVDSGAYDAVVLTEMVEIRDAIAYHDAPVYLRKWAERAAAANPDARIYLYETWHRLDDPEGWLERIDRDLDRAWEGELLARAQDADGPRIYVVPAGQVMARFVREIEARGGVDGLARAQDLFSDDIHLNDVGAYLVALTHYATLYHRSPVGLPRELTRADGTPAVAPGPEAARLMQEIVWDVVRSYPKTGVAQEAPRTAAVATDG